MSGWRMVNGEIEIDVEGSQEAAVRLPGSDVVLFTEWPWVAGGAALGAGAMWAAKRRRLAWVLGGAAFGAFVAAWAGHVVHGEVFEVGGLRVWEP